MPPRDRDAYRQAVIDSRQLRPGRGWYVLAVLIIVLLGAAGPAVFVLVTLSAIPEVKAEFLAGTPTTVDLTADRKWAIYLATPDAESPIAPSRCEAKALDGGTISLFDPAGYSFSFSRDGGTWQLLTQMTVTRGGRFEIVCDPVAGGPQLYGVAEDPELSGFFGRILGGLGALAGLPCLGALTGAIIILVVALRRASYKRKLQQRYTGYPPAGPHGYWSR
jgi:hypothetical protein